MIKDAYSLYVHRFWWSRRAPNVYTHMHTHMHTYIYTHTRTHAHARAWRWQTYIQAISVAPEHMETCSHAPFHGTTSRPTNCSSHFAVGVNGANSSAADLQGRFAAWRPYYTAKLRAALGPEKIIIANAAMPATADPALNGVTVEFEHCAGDENPHLRRSGGGGGGGVDWHSQRLQAVTGGVRSRGGFALNDVCTQAFEGQKALTDMAGLPNVFALWLTHSEVVPAEQQCAELARVQKLLPWIREGDDVTDCTREGGPASCVRCNFSSSAASSF